MSGARSHEADETILPPQQNANFFISVCGDLQLPASFAANCPSFQTAENPHRYLPSAGFVARSLMRILSVGLSAIAKIPSVPISVQQSQKPVHQFPEELYANDEQPHARRSELGFVVSHFAENGRIWFAPLPASDLAATSDQKSTVDFDR